MDCKKKAILVAHQLVKNYVLQKGLFHKKIIKALNGVSFSIGKGCTLAVVGESGCGKSTLARQLVLIERPTTGFIEIEGELVCTRHDVARVRRYVQMVFQNPIASLNPRKTVMQTLLEPLKINTNLSRVECNERVLELLNNVGLNSTHAELYPHMFSGGQCQRIAIARAMILNPKIVIADEPVSALDGSIQAQIINLFIDLQENFSTSYIFISHDLLVVKHIADDVMVMYLGKVVEIGKKEMIFSNPLHPYTKLLMSSIPSMSYKAFPIKQFSVIEEPNFSMDYAPSGCLFYRRCPYSVEKCRQETPNLVKAAASHQVRCHRFQEIN